MRKKIVLNQNWQFHLGELEQAPLKIAKKAYAFGGFTASLPEEKQARLPISAGGNHFLKLIAQGNTEVGLRNLCATDLESKLDASWKEIDLPHDWKVELPYDNNPMNVMAGSKPDGVAYYRKRFALADKIYQKNRVILHFEGISRMADIWLNGAYLGHNNSGYTECAFDITEMAYYGDEGENTLLVRAETTSGSEGWWYEGAGIYKNVYCEILPDVHLEEDDLYVYTKSLESGKAIIGIELGVTNNSDTVIAISPNVTLAGQTILFDMQTMNLGETVYFTAKTAIEDPKLWTPETPHLYEAVATIANDQIVKTFGVHTFDYDESGFFLNGQPYELHGICEHQDFAGVGVAVNQDILNYKIQVMKKMGVNAWRSAHHFASKELLAACDKFGILILNENRLPEATPWRMDDFKKMIKKSRMNASLAFWSLGNEELVGNTPYGSRTVKKLAEIVKSLDYEHLTISAELLNLKGIVDDDYLSHFDILGVNYPEAGVMGAGAELIKQSHPQLPMMSTENASYFSTRGIYKDNANKCHCNGFGSMYSMVLPGKRQPGDPGVGGTARPEEVIHYLNTHKYMGGVFLWTAFDYFGEPSPFAFPGISSQFGICDMNGFPKDYYYYYQAHWTNQPMVHVMPHWNKEGLELDNTGHTLVRAFSNADEVELFINGVSQGKQAVVDCTIDWKVLYEPGVLKVIAYQHDMEVASDQQVSSQKVDHLKQEVIYSGQEIDLVAISAQDKQNNFVPTAENQIYLSTNQGQIIGLGNGNPADISDFSLETIKLFSGKALAIVKKGDNAESTITISF